MIEQEKNNVEGDAKFLYKNGGKNPIIPPPPPNCHGYSVDLLFSFCFSPFPNKTFSLSLYSTL